MLKDLKNQIKNLPREVVVTVESDDRPLAVTVCFKDIERINIFTPVQITMIALEYVEVAIH